MTAIWRVTVLEARRKKTLLVLSIITLIFLVLWTLGYVVAKNAISTNFGRSEELGLGFLLIGFSFLVMFSTLTAILTGSSSIANDCETGLLHGVLSRPVTRLQYLAGRLAGALTVSLCFSAASFGALMLLCALLGITSAGGVALSDILTAWLYLALMQTALVALAQALGARLRTAATNIILLSMYFIGDLGSSMVALRPLSEGVYKVGYAIIHLSPFSAIGSLASQQLSDVDFMSGLSGQAVNSMPDHMPLWTVCYIALAGLCAWLLFRKRDL